MPEIEVNIEVYCTCGEGLCNQTESTRTRHRKEAAFIVTPCEKCMARARDTGDEKGYDRGFDEGSQVSDRNLEAAFERGKIEGFALGYSDGKAETDHVVSHQA